MMFPRLVAIGALIMTAVSSQAQSADPSSMSASDVTQVLQEIGYATQSLNRLKANWEEFSSDLRKSEPSYTPTERAARLRELTEGFWVDSEQSLQRLSGSLRAKTMFPVGERIKALANLDEVRGLVVAIIGDDEVSRSNGYLVRLRDSWRNQSGALIAGSGELSGAERTAWEQQTFDPIDSYMYYSFDALSRVKLATATWADVRVSRQLGGKLSELLEPGIYRTDEAIDFCKLEIRKSPGAENWIHVRTIFDSTTRRCQVSSGHWQILNCDNYVLGSCNGIFHESQSAICRVYRPGTQYAEFEAICSDWIRSFKFKKI